MDISLPKYILNAHSKVQNKLLYLETGAFHREILMSRRCLYLQKIIKRDNKELLKKIYNAQKENPLKGDWILMVKKYFEDIGLIFNEEETIKENKSQFKERIKKRKKITFVLKKLKVEQKEHSKISHICYSSF